MKFLSVALPLASLAVGVNGRSLSYRMKASESMACFHAYIDPKINFSNALLQFYFSVSDARGSENVFANYKVLGPSGQELQQQQHLTHSEVNVRPTMSGDYALCLSHSGSPSDKNVDVDISLPSVPIKLDVTNLTKEEINDGHKLEETVVKLKKELRDLLDTLRGIKTRQKRNSETVENIAGLIFYTSVFEVLLIFGMSLLQVTVLRMFFGGSGKPRV